MRLVDSGNNIADELVRNWRVFDLIRELDLQHHSLFLAGLAYISEGSKDLYDWVSAVVSRTGDILAWDTPAHVEPADAKERFAHDQVFEDPDAWINLSRYVQLRSWNDRWRRRELADHLDRYSVMTTAEFAARLLESWLGRDCTRGQIAEAKHRKDRPREGPVFHLEDAFVLGVVPVEITAALNEQLEAQNPTLAAYVRTSAGEIPPPHRALPEWAKQRYAEAREIAASSPRSAAALLRVALEVLLNEVRPSSGTLADRIDELQALGLPAPHVQAMDILRLIGNQAVHTGTIVDADSPETVQELFGYLNHLAESNQMIRRIADRYTTMPKGAQDAAEQRRAAKQQTEHPQTE
jgi:Domain of unknown function (DUF4145)